jgi:hypothetical protein
MASPSCSLLQKIPHPLSHQLTGSQSSSVLALQWRMRSPRSPSGASGGGLTVPTKALGGERIAALYWLSQSSGPDFETTARVEGRRVLQERLGADAHEPTINTLVDGTLEILDKVSTCMRATAN